MSMQRMTGKEFKRENHFRNCGDRSCMNCRHCCSRTTVSHGPEGTSETTHYTCGYGRDGDGRGFRIFNFTVCDLWSRGG